MGSDDFVIEAGRCEDATSGNCNAKVANSHHFISIPSQSHPTANSFDLQSPSDLPCMFFLLDISGVVKSCSGGDSFVLSSQILYQVPHWDKYAGISIAWCWMCFLGPVGPAPSVCPAPSEAATSQLLAQNPL